MSNVVGTWVITTDFGCDGSIAGSFDQTFHADGTWTNTIGSNGRWFQIEGLVQWDFNNAAKLIYAANLAGSWMAGSLGYTTVGGLKGCFGAHRAGVPGLATKALEAKRVRPDTGQKY
ncbi:MAG: hypothetical protein ACRD72_06615 [Candidatus Angelobacter sp.]